MLIELIVKRGSEKEGGISPWLWMKAIGILLLAVAGCFLGTYENIVHIIRIYSIES